MSAMTAGTTARTSVPRTTPRPARPAPKAAPLRLVPQRRSTAARAPFVVTVVSLLVLGLLGLLLLNTVVNQQSFRLHDLAKQGRLLDLHEQELQTAAQAQSAPGTLSARATQLGMVPGGPPAFLRLPDGKILGATSAAPAAPARPAVQPAVKPAAPTLTASSPAATKPAGTKPAAATRPGATTATTAPQLRATKPAETKPAATKPAATQPSTTSPTGSTR